MACVNLYSDVERRNRCDDVEGETLYGRNESSKVFDLPILLIALYHIIEWIRMAVLLTVICIGIDVTFAWYVLVPNTIFGIAAYIVAHIRYFGDDG